MIFFPSIYLLGTKSQRLSKRNNGRMYRISFLYLLSSVRLERRLSVTSGRHWTDIGNWSPEHCGHTASCWGGRESFAFLPRLNPMRCPYPPLLRIPEHLGWNTFPARGCRSEDGDYALAEGRSIFLLSLIDQASKVRSERAEAQSFEGRPFVSVPSISRTRTWRAVGRSD